ncbi:hypothetical protein [Pseudodesulfovibrio sediminis]|uniref:Leucine Rich repeats (2 copies) n=1 Tax=Pseudodesulfovibrio sediminis TaxID=2810563 RepID=A0ABM7P8T8_9BACT|nr:hypothetical protein [Pseudodesulfovibrio sediminis]BCS89411.1 hypothetical protein PSDVSF_26530 [Pseudodesulfovibrio sediminis]
MRNMSFFVSLSVALLMVLTMLGFKSVQSKKMQPIQKQELQTTSPVNLGASDMRAAQVWLKSVGYDLTFDQMKTLKRLNLQKYSIAIQNNISDDNMRHVKVLTNLEILQLPQKIGDKGLQHVAGLTKLKSLNMPKCKITDNGMQHLHNLTQLDSLVMAATNISDAGVAKIKHLRPTVLNLTRTKITDAGVVMLSGMQLRLLFISFTDITDASVPELAKHRSLERLDIQGRNGISQQGFEQLKAALPSTRIVYP